MKEFYFLKLDICICNYSYISVSKSVFTSIILDYTQYVQIKKKCHGFINDNFLDVRIFAFPIGLFNTDSDPKEFFDIIGFSVCVPDEMFYSFIFSSTTFPDGSGLPEEVGKVVDEFEKEFCYG